jgi:hypothetical protein
MAPRQTICVGGSAFLAFYGEHRNEDWISSDLLRIELTRAVSRHWRALVPDAQRLLGPELTALLTYDDHLAKAAEEAGIPVHTPRAA